MTLDDLHAEKLRRLTERTHVNARNVTGLLDGIAGAFEGAQLGLQQIREGGGKPLDDL